MKKGAKKLKEKLHKAFDDGISLSEFGDIMKDEHFPEMMNNTLQYLADVDAERKAYRKNKKKNKKKKGE